MRPSATAHTDFIATTPLRLRCVNIRFASVIPWDDVTDTLELSRMAVESLYGAERVAIALRWQVDTGSRSVSIDTSTAVGRSLDVIFLGYAKREFGDVAVHISQPSRPAAAGGKR